MRKKTVITLDPEYIPWEPGAPVVKLRRRRNKKMAAIVSAVVGVLLCGGLGLYGYLNRPPETPVELPALADVAPAVTPGHAPTPSLITQAQPGQLAIVQDNVVRFFLCASYSVMSGETILSEGTTVEGAIVDVSRSEGVVIECENETFNLQ